MRSSAATATPTTCGCTRSPFLRASTPRGTLIGPFPEAGEPFQPLKLYYNAWNRRQFIERHEKFLELGLPSPYAERIDKGWLEQREEGPQPTTLIDLTGFENVRREALIAHATQIDPTSLNWFGLPDEVERSLHQHDRYVLAKSRVSRPLEHEEYRPVRWRPRELVSRS